MKITEICEEISENLREPEAQAGNNEIEKSEQRTANSARRIPIFNFQLLMVFLHFNLSLNRPWSDAEIKYYV
jgi:hypothetical protein